MKSQFPTMADVQMLEKLAKHPRPAEGFAFIHLKRAVVCVECEAIFDNSEFQSCPSCGDAVVLHLENFVPHVECSATLKVQYDPWKSIGYAEPEVRRRA